MTPLNFVVYDGDSQPNTPAYKIAEALQRDIKIRSRINDWEVLSYYYDEHDHCMVLDIGKIQCQH